MEENKQRLLAVDGVNLRVQQHIETNQAYFIHATQKFKTELFEVYEKAAWIDANLNDSCAVDPFFGFHFFEEADAAAFKLRWE